MSYILESFLRLSSFLEAVAPLGLALPRSQSVCLSAFSKKSVGGSRICPVKSCIDLCSPLKPFLDQYSQTYFCKLHAPPLYTWHIGILPLAILKQGGTLPIIIDIQLWCSAWAAALLY